MDDSDFTIHRACEADAGAVFRLVSEMHGRDVRGRIDWFYRSNPHGTALSWIARDQSNREPVGVTSIFPRKVMVAGTVRIGSIGGDCYIAPAARRRGLATQLHRATRESMRDGGVEFMYGPPLHHNLGALVKAGAREVSVFRRYVRPLKATVLSDLARRVAPRAVRDRIPVVDSHLLDRLMQSIDRRRRALGPLEHRLEPIESFDEEWDRWFFEHAAAYPVCCVRDSEYLNFRYPRRHRSTRRPYLLHDSSELAGMLVLTIDRRSRTGFVTDMFTRLDEDECIAALRLASIEALAQGCSRIEIRTAPLPTLVTALSRAGFHWRDKRDPWVFQVLAPEGTHRDEPFFEATAWHFLDGDQDLPAPPEA